MTAQVQLARKQKEKASGPLWGELNVLLYGTPNSPEKEQWCLIRCSKTVQYWVSDLGHFAVWREGPAAIWVRNGYPQGVVYVDGRTRPRAIHTLVATQFCKWKPGDKLVRHLNSNRHDNHANNLMPGLHSENMRDRKNKLNGIVPEVLPPLREVWKLSDTYAGVRISNMGRVTLGWWVVFNSDGYSYKQGARKRTKKHVSLKIVLEGTVRYELLHRLMYEAFIGAIPPRAQIRHWNDDPHDNRLENLVVGTPANNVADRIRNGHQRYGQDHPNAKYSDKQRGRFIELIASGLNTREAASLAGIGIHTAYQILWRIRKGLPVKTDKS